MTIATSIRLSVEDLRMILSGINQYAQELTVYYGKSFYNERQVQVALHLTDDIRNLLKNNDFKDNGLAVAILKPLEE